MVDFETNAGLLSSLGISVIAASVDSAELTSTLREGLRLNYVTMASDVDAAAVAESTGAFWENGKRVILQATGFLLNPEGMVDQSVYSSGPIGRFTANDVLKKVRFAQQQAK